MGVCLYAAPILLLLSTAHAFTLTWYQAPPTPPVTNYNLYANVTPGAAESPTPIQTWPPTDATPAGTNVWKHNSDLLFPTDVVQLQSCNCDLPRCCSDLSNTKVVPTYTPSLTPTPSRTETPTPTTTPSRTPAGQTPKAPLLWDVR